MANNVLMVRHIVFYGFHHTPDINIFLIFDHYKKLYCLDILLKFMASLYL